MAKAHLIQNTFNAGELSPLLDGRSDLSKYANGADTLENFIPMVQGGLQRRPGSVYVAEVKDSSKSTRLVEFEFSTSQAYIIEFGDLYCRFYKNNGRIETGEFSDEFASEFAQQDPVELTTTYAEADLFQLKFSQSADILYIAHPSYPPRKLSRTSDTSWSIETIAFEDGPFLGTNATTTTLTLSGTSGSVTVTASAVTGINDDTGFQTTDVGRLIRWKDPANNWTWLEITARSSTTVVTATIQGPNASAGTATENWRLGVWSDTTGYPAAVTFYEDRLWWGGGVNYPQRLDGSRTGDYENMAPTDPDGTVLDDSGVSFTLNANNVNVIRWMIDDEKGLLVGTVGGEWIVRANSTQDVVTPSNIQAKRSSTYGSADQQPVRAGKAILFVQRAKQKVRELAYVFEDDGFRAPDMTLLSEHITLGGIVEATYQQEPQSIIWYVRADGTLLGLTYERNQEVIGWHRHILGGQSDATGTQAKVESVASIPSSDGSSDELWVVVNRYINGATVRYVEYLKPLFTESTDQEDAFFVDSGLTYSGTSATTILNLFHLEGETVSILNNGASHPDKTVSASGTVTLDTATTKAQIGLGYNSNFYSLKPDAGASDGTAQGKIKRINQVDFRFWRSLGVKVGEDADNLDTVVFRTGADNMDTAVPLFTGDKEVEWDASYDSDAQIYVRQDQPFPCNLLAIMPRIVTQDP